MISCDCIGLRVPRQLELAEPALAAHHRAPLVEREVRIAAERAPRRRRRPRSARAAPGSGTGSARRCRGTDSRRRDTTAAAGRLRTAGTPSRAGCRPTRSGRARRRATDVERALDLRIVEQRVVDGRDEALLLRRARPIASASASSSAIGFSISTWQPRSSAASATFACDDGGVSTWITFAPAAIERVEVGERAACPTSRRWPARALASRSVTPTSSTSGASFFTAATWNSQMLPAPTMPARKRAVLIVVSSLRRSRRRCARLRRRAPTRSRRSSRPSARRAPPGRPRRARRSIAATNSAGVAAIAREVARSARPRAPASTRPARPPTGTRAA